MIDPTDNGQASVSDGEKTRALYDYVMFRPDRSEYQIQSSLIANMILPSTDNQLSLDAQLSRTASAAAAAVNEEGPSIFSAEDEDDIVTSIIRSMSSSAASTPPPSSSSSYSLEEGLQFASDLRAIKNSIVAVARTTHTLPEHSISMDPTHTKRTAANAPAGKSYSLSGIFEQGGKDTEAILATCQSSSNRSSTNNHNRSNNDSNNNNSKEQHTEKRANLSQPVNPQTAAVQKKNPFKTGKDQYLNEGGKFAANPNNDNNASAKISQRVFGGPQSSNGSGKTSDDKPPLPPELAHLDRNLVEKIEGDIIHKGQNKIRFADIAGLEFAKKCVMEIICW